MCWMLDCEDLGSVAQDHGWPVMARSAHSPLPPSDTLQGPLRCPNWKTDQYIPLFRGPSGELINRFHFLEAPAQRQFQELGDLHSIDPKAKPHKGTSVRNGGEGHLSNSNLFCYALLSMHVVDGKSCLQYTMPSSQPILPRAPYKEEQWLAVAQRCHG